MEPIRHILVAIDFYAPSLRATAYAVRLARSVGAELTLLHAYDASAPFYPTGLSNIPASEIRMAAERELADIVAKIRPHAVEARSVLRVGTPVREILETARKINADLIVLGTQGRHGLPRLLLGSVAEEVVRRSSVPVITMHEWRFQNRAEATPILANLVYPLRGEFDATIAITRGAVPIAIGVAAALETPVDVLIVEPIGQPHEAPIGAACEDGSFIFDRPQSFDHDAAERAKDAALVIAHQHARWLSDPQGPRSVADARVLLVSDVVVCPAVALVAAQAMARRGAKRVSLAVPVCASSIPVALPPAIENTLYLESTQLESPFARVYGDEEYPSSVEAAELLVRAGHRRVALQATLT